MYYPILRGKLNELLALRELANISTDKMFCPVIEPVKTSLAPLFKTIKELNDEDIVPLIIINPTVGDLQGESHYILDQLEDELDLQYLATFAIRDDVSEVENLIIDIDKYALFIVDGLNQEIIDASREAEFTFIRSTTPPHLIKKISNVILYNDFFNKQKRNADYPIESGFSSLHSYYTTIDNVKGFGDYTTLSESYSESGGPAYVVTIHATYINEEKFEEAFIRHYSSVSDDDKPTNPGKKFLEALGFFMSDEASGKVKFSPTAGLQKFQKVYHAKHFPGLGQVKKMSIMHHIETINDYLIGVESLDE